MSETLPRQLSDGEIERMMVYLIDGSRLDDEEAFLKYWEEIEANYAAEGFSEDDLEELTREAGRRRLLFGQAINRGPEAFYD